MIIYKHVIKCKNMNLARQFSKELAPNLRKETADQLKEARNRPENYDEWKKNKTEGLSPLELEEIKKNIWGRLLKTEEYKEQLRYVNNCLKNSKKEEIEKIRNDYDKEFEKIMSECPLSEEEREKYLSTEALSKMDLEDYLVLLKRLSGGAFYHVTRYGIRENTFTSSGGGHTFKKDEFVDSFTNLLKDGKINSLSSTIIKNQNIFFVDDSEIIDLAKKGNSVDDIVEDIMITYNGIGGRYLDRESSHFSYGKDLHTRYGCEDDYKFYFYYPVEYVLQNDFYQYNRESINLGDTYYRNEFGIDNQYNDAHIFNFGEGVPVDAGILCISGDVNVDPDTGSQYIIKDGKKEVDESGNFKKPEKTISSKEYWEKFFSKNPEIKPNKIIYYNFFTISKKEDKNLKELENRKVPQYQNEEKLKEFSDYSKETRDKIREIARQQVKDVLSRNNGAN